MRVWAIGVLAVFPVAAWGQIFFDDFQGPELAPHWNASRPSHWDYNFNNGMLNVTGLHYPSHPHSSGNWASMAAHFAPQTDFRADIWMGWDVGQPWHSLTVSIVGPEFRGIALFTYSNEGIFAPGPTVEVSAGSNQFVFAAAPPPGVHQFTMSRTGSQLRFLLNGDPFATFPDQFGTPLTTLFFVFTRSYPGEFAPLYVDRVLIVPSPGAGVVAWLLVIAATSRGRR